jgi:hypothetical protein
MGAVSGDSLVQISVTLFACYLCFLVAEFEAAAGEYTRPLLSST